MLPKIYELIDKHSRYLTVHIILVKRDDQNGAVNIGYMVCGYLAGAFVEITDNFGSRIEVVAHIYDQALYHCILHRLTDLIFIGMVEHGAVSVHEISISGLISFDGNLAEYLLISVGFKLMIAVFFEGIVYDMPVRDGQVKHIVGNGVVIQVFKLTVGKKYKHRSGDKRTTDG